MDLAELADLQFKSFSFYQENPEGEELEEPLKEEPPSYFLKSISTLTLELFKPSLTVLQPFEPKVNDTTVPITEYQRLLAENQRLQNKIVRLETNLTLLGSKLRDYTFKKIRDRLPLWLTDTYDLLEVLYLEKKIAWTEPTTNETSSLLITLVNGAKAVNEIRTVQGLGKRIIILLQYLLN